MQLPAFWWLLAIVVLVQGAFFVRFVIVRLRKSAVQSLARPATMLLFASGAAGLAYGVAQSDPLFFLGQACLLVIYSRMQQTKHDG